MGALCLYTCLLVYTVQSLTFLLTFIFVCQRLFCLLLTCRGGDGWCLCDCLLVYNVTALLANLSFCLSVFLFCFVCLPSLGMGGGGGA